MIKLVVFDLDGTLVNSVYDLADAVNTVLERYGYPIHKTDKYYQFVGNGTVKLVERALPEYARDKANVERLHSAFLKQYSEHCLDKTIAYNGVAELLDKLSEMGIKTAVASNKTDVFTKLIVKELFCSHSFQDAVGKLDGVPRKPSPEIVHSILKKTDVKADEALYVGDSDVDVMTGHNAGLLVCGCEWGFRGKEELVRAGCDFLLEKPEDLIDVILKLK